MKGNNLIWLVGGAGLAYLLYQHYNQEKVKQNNRFIAAIRVQITDAKIQGNKLHLVFNMQNPNSTPVVIRSIVGEVTVNGVKYGLVKSFTQVTIQPNNETQYEVEVQIKFAAAVTTILDLLTKRVANTVLVFTGTVNADNKAMPLNLKFTL